MLERLLKDWGKWCGGHEQGHRRGDGGPGRCPWKMGVHGVGGMAGSSACFGAQEKEDQVHVRDVFARLRGMVQGGCFGWHGLGRNVWDAWAGETGDQVDAP